jgi:hypothetical protein
VEKGVLNSKIDDWAFAGVTKLVLSGNGMLELSEEQRIELSKWALSRTLAAGDVFRARLILALADGPLRKRYRR